MNNYVGNKGGQGIRENLINYIPCSHRYFSLFYGAGGLENCKYLNGTHWVCAEKNIDNKKYETKRAVIVYNDYKDLIEDFYFNASDFIFADPPYLLSTRINQRRYYKYEFEIQDHIEFLNYVISLKARILITHPSCDLYSEKLKDWVKVPFSYMTRNGMYNDCIWMNYTPGSIELYNYDCLGNNFTERQQIKRRNNNLLNKIENLPFHERKKVLREISHRYF